MRDAACLRSRIAIGRRVSEDVASFGRRGRCHERAAQHLTAEVCPEQLGATDGRESCGSSAHGGGQARRQQPQRARPRRAEREQRARRAAHRTNHRLQSAMAWPCRFCFSQIAFLPCACSWRSRPRWGLGGQAQLTFNLTRVCSFRPHLLYS